MRMRLLSVVVLVLLLASACGGKKGSSSSANVNLDTLVLVASDFPSGWTSQPSGQANDAEGKAAEDELSKCVGVSGSDAEVATKDGDDFSQSAGVQVSSAVNRVKDDATFRSDVAALKKSDKVTSCMKTTFADALKKLVPGVSEIEVSDLSVPRHGDVTVARRLTMSATVAGQQLKIYIDAVLMGKKRAELNQSFTSVGKPFDASLERALVNKVGGRLDAA